tara:strand:+ start:504 stop:710 length:207 start_codon:yes stop_codon:yes gene_type:complete
LKLICCGDEENEQSRGDFSGKGDVYLSDVTIEGGEERGQSGRKARWERGGALVEYGEERKDNDENGID